MYLLTLRENRPYVAGLPSAEARSMDKHRTALILFAVALGMVIVVASVTTVEQVKAQKVSAAAASGTTGLAKPYPPLDPRTGRTNLERSVAAFPR